jgi:hypothetical protein
MSAPDLTRARELAASLRAELERLIHAAPADAELRAAHELAAQLCPKLAAVAAARGYVDPPRPDVTDPDAG